MKVAFELDFLTIISTVSIVVGTILILNGVAGLIDYINKKYNN